MKRTEDVFHLGIKALIRNASGEILLLKVNPAKLKGTIKEYWDIPGGRVQRGDTVEQTLRREVAEETGVTDIEDIQPLAMVLSNIRIPLQPEDVGLILSVFTCSIRPDTPITLSDEHIDLGWFAPKEAAQLLQVKYPQEFTSKIEKL